MEIRFRTPLLRKSFESFRLASQKYGEAVARKYIQRITLIKQAKNLNEIMAMHGLRCHALRGDRKGQYAITLDYRYRLIFTLSRNEIEVVWIEEVSKHYDD